MPDWHDAHITVLPSFWQRLKLGLCGNYELCECKNKIMILGIIAMLQVPLVLGVQFELKPLYVAGGIVDVGIAIGSTLYGISQCRNYVIAQVQNNPTA